jgi:hypothetical protein
LGGVWSRFFTEHDYVHGLIPLFNFGEERNLPTFFSGGLHLVIAFLFWAIWKSKRNAGVHAPCFIFLAYLFCFTALDEIVQIHELVGRPLRSLLNATGIFYYTWFVAYLPVVALLSVALFPTIRTVPPAIRKWLLISAMIFLVGSVGFKMPEGWYMERYGQDHLVYALMVACEEFLEILGLSMAVYALLRLLESEHGGFRVVVPGNS